MKQETLIKKIEDETGVKLHKLRYEDYRKTWKTIGVFSFGKYNQAIVDYRGVIQFVYAGKYEDEISKVLLAPNRNEFNIIFDYLKKNWRQ